MTNDLISREAALKELREWGRSLDSLSENVLMAAIDCVCERIEEYPAVDAAPVVHGRLVYRDGYNTPVCSECGCVFKDVEWLFCPNCGAKMDKEDEDAKEVDRL